MFCIDVEETSKNPNATVIGTLLVNHLCVQILFDSGATHSFIKSKLAEKLTCDPEEIDVQLCITTPVGSVYYTNTIFRDCAVSMNWEILPTNLIQLECKAIMLFWAWIG